MSDYIKIPIKKTNSSYYARLRAQKVDPKKKCLYCGLPLQRRYNPNNGRWEDWNSYVRRDYCDRSCCHKAIKGDKRAELLKGYKPCKEYEGLSVDIEGNFMLNGKKKKVIKTEGKTARIIILHEGKKTYFQASRLVATAWKGASDDDYIDYKDGNIHNISAHNLSIVSKDEYYRKRLEKANASHKTNTYEYQLSRLENVIVEAEAVLYYFKTGSMEKVNKHVEDYLYKNLLDFSLRSLHMGMLEAKDRVADAIARFYEVILNGHAVSHAERYCKMLLVKEKKLGWYTHIGDIPKKIELKIHHELNLERLWNKYNVKQFK